MATALGSIACAPLQQAYSQSRNCSYASSSLQRKKASVLSSVFLPKNQRYPTQYPTLTTTSITSTTRGGGSSQSSSQLLVTATISKEKEVAEGRGIEQNMLDEKPATLLRETQSDAVNNLQLRAQFEQMAFRVQNEVCTAVEAVDGGKFREEAWSGEGGRGFGRVLQDRGIGDEPKCGFVHPRPIFSVFAADFDNGTVWEKAGVNVSVLSGIMSPEAYRAATGTTGVANEAGGIPFYASGVTSVMHPRNPFAPSVHFNYRYFETEGVEGAPRVWWFGGGTDLTPSYLFEEDVKHFHEFQKKACDKFDPAFYPKFKSWCDDYFLVKHRAERRGLGGIFFDNLNDRDPEQLLAFATACADTVIPAYIPLVEKRKDTPFSEPQKDWQQLRRGRYVEFNLVHDRGTAFGLKMGVRIESILMPLPLTARWEYDHHPKENSAEWKLLEACKKPRDWV